MPQQKQDDDIRDYFDEYCISIFFPNWPFCKDLAAALVAARDDNMELNIQKYRDASSERQLYTPFRYLANRAFATTRHALEAAGPGVRHDGEADLADLPNLLAVPAHDRPLLGCASERK